MSDITSEIARTKRDLIGGVEKVFLFPFTKYSYSQIVLDGQRLATFPSTTAYELYSVSSSFTENTEIEGGDIAWKQTFSLEFPKTEYLSEIYKFSFKDYRAIYIDRNGNIRILGLYNGLEAQITNETGNGKGDFSGYRVTFTGKEDNQAYFINNLADTGFIIPVIYNYVFEDGCNYVFED